MAMADVTVLGAGIFGLSVAWACVQRGARVRVIDPHGPGAGSSGGIVGALAPHVPEQWNDKKAFQFDSLMMAGDFWQEVEAASGLSTGYARLGRLQPVADEAALDLARIRALSATELWQGHAVWEVLRADEGGDWMPASPSGWVIRDTLTARLHPRMACAALVDALRARGAEVVADHARQGAVVHATGAAGLAEIGTTLGRSFGNGVKGQAALLALDMREAAQLFVDTVHAGVRPRSRSRAPVLGAHPVFKDQFIANGGFKIGFGMAPKVAQVMADLVLDGVDRIPPGFRPEASL